MPQVNRALKAGDLFTQRDITQWVGTPPKNCLFIVSKKGTKITPAYPMLDGVGVQVQGWNKKSKTWSTKTPTQAAYYNFEPPAKPSVTFTPGGEGSNFLITVSITSPDEKSTRRERYDTVYRVTADYNFYEGKKLGRATKGKVVVSSRSNTKRNITFTLNPQSLFPSGYSGIGNLKKDEYITYYVEAYNRGIAGDSALYKIDNKLPYITIARPADTKIVGNKINKSGGFCRIAYDLSGSTRVTETVTLQRLANWRPSGSGYATPVDDWTDQQWLNAAKNETSGWQDVYTVGKKVGVFSDPAYNAYAEPFKRTYYRVVPKNGLYMLGDGTPSDPVVVAGYLEIPSARNEAFEFSYAAPTEDGKAIQVTAVFQKTKTSQGKIRSNGTEMSWSTLKYAWQSSSGPSTYDFTDKDYKTVRITDEVIADKTAKRFRLVNADHKNWVLATYYLAGVNSGEKYYIKGRRFLKDSASRETDSYGKYACYEENGAQALVEVVGKPEEVKLTAPEKLVEGHDLSVTWTYDSNLLQTHYSLYYSNAAENGEKIAFPAQYTNVKSNAPYAVLKWEDVERKFEACQDTIYIGVQIRVIDGGTSEKDKGTAYGVWSEMSNITTTKLQRRPVGEFKINETLSAQPLEVSIGSSNNAAAIILRVVAENATMGWGPMGQDNQASGSIVKSVRHKPNWTEAKIINGTPWYEANYKFESDLDFRNNARYRVDYTVIDEETNLRTYVSTENGELVPDSKTLLVEWAKELSTPVFYVVGDPVTEEHDMKARIVILGISDGVGGYISELSKDYDDVVADIYRVTPDGVYLLAQGVENWCGYTITDKFPAYSKYNGTLSTFDGVIGPDYPTCRYRVALRSPNADTQWSDRAYSMNGYCIRFDWGVDDAENHGEFNHLVLPYNIKWSDSWTKNSRVELHLDGKYSGYWRGGVDRKNTMATELVRFQGADQVARVRSLARYAGPVLVRLPDGCVFSADVQVSNLDSSFDSQTITASFSAQEISMDAAFSTDSVSIEKGLYKPISPSS